MATNYAKNLGSGTLASAISASSTSLSVYVGEGSSSTIQGVWPSVPFYASIMPATPSAGVPNSLDSEIVKVTAVSSSGSNTTLTVTRAQRGTTAKAFSQGAIVTNADYAEDAVLLSDEGTSSSNTPWVSGTDIIWSSMWSYIVDKIYPVGSIFISATLSTASAVGNALGGTWVAISQGRCIMGAGEVQDNTDDWCGHTSAGDWTGYAGLMGGQVWHNHGSGNMGVCMETFCDNNIGRWYMDYKTMRNDLPPYTQNARTYTSGRFSEPTFSEPSTAGIWLMQPLPKKLVRAWA